MVGEQCANSDSDDEERGLISIGQLNKAEYAINDEDLEMNNIGFDFPKITKD